MMFQAGQEMRVKKSNYYPQDRIKSKVKSKRYFRTTTSQFGSCFGGFILFYFVQYYLELQVFPFQVSKLFCFKVIPQFLFSNLENYKVKNNLDLIVKLYLLMYQLVITIKHFNYFVISQKSYEHIRNFKL